MSFIEGYIVARSLSRGRYRPAAPGTGLFLYGGAVAAGGGLAALMNGHSDLWPVPVIGIVMVIVGLCMQGERRSPRSDSSLAGALTGATLTLGALALILYIYHP